MGVVIGVEHLFDIGFFLYHELFKYRQQFNIQVMLLATPVGILVSNLELESCAISVQY